MLRTRDDDPAGGAFGVVFELERGERLVYCAGGYRSSIAASLLQLHGHVVGEIAGGITAWEAAKLPVATGADA